MPVLLLKVIAGSRLYGTDTPESDTDHGEVWLEDLDSLFSLDPPGDMGQVVGEIDTQRHWFKKFMKLVVAGNPNVIEWLFAEGTRVLAEHEAFENIKGNISHILGYEGLIRSHLGYAEQQVQKMCVLTGSWGAERKKLVEKYGYDTKFAMHAIRLLCQLQTLAKHGWIAYPYPDYLKDAFREIRAGVLSKEDFLVMYEDARKITKEKSVGLKDHFKEKADLAVVTDLMKGVYQHVYSGRF